MYWLWVRLGALEGRQDREKVASTLDCTLTAHGVLFQMNRWTEERWAESPTEGLQTFCK